MGGSYVFFLWFSLSGLVVGVQLLEEGSHMVEMIPLPPQTNLTSGQTPLLLTTLHKETLHLARLHL